MSKLNTFLSILKKIITNPSSLNMLVDKELEMKQYLLDKYGFDQLPTVDIKVLFPSLCEEVDNYTFLDGSSTILDIVLLKQLARQFTNCSYLEIGSWRGESIYNVSQVAGKCTSLTLSANDMKLLNFQPGMIELDGLFSNHVKNIKKIEHNSFTYNFSNFTEKFDLIFVDGDHSYKGIKSDTANVLNLLNNDASVIVWHDYSIGFESVRYSVLAGILDSVPRDMHRYLYHVSNTMCAILIKKGYGTYITKFPTRPNKAFLLNVSVHDLEVN